MKVNKDQAKQMATILTAVSTVFLGGATAAYFDKQSITTTEFCVVIGLIIDVYWIAVTVLDEKYARN